MQLKTQVFHACLVSKDRFLIEAVFCFFAVDLLSLVIADLPAVNQFLSLRGCLVAFMGALFVMESNAKIIAEVNVTKNRVLQEIALLEGDVEAYLVESQVPISKVTIRQALKKRIKTIKALINE